ncbi:hypothetical protein MAR_038030 [Mya arenaria]|uniref:EGF-like domain-containing protein n=1 Tax=Mya arenaria TaxID=6604 RepID=A0ABY7FU26_MYAAR|nr:hypothetical protein MAR_038030 [Mya arenaria]
MNQSNLPQDESRRVMLADGHGDDEPPQPNDSSYGQIGTVLLALGFVIGYCINHQIKLEENSNPLQLISKEQGAIFLRDQRRTCAKSDFIKEPGCHLVQMAPDKYCGKNGDLICKNNTEPPFCNCKCNWTGEMCDKMDVQKVMCNCFTLGKPIAYADSMKSCNDAGRPANWTECILDGKREDTAMNCICAPLNTTDIRC